MAILTLAETLQVTRIVVDTSNIPTSITATAQPIYDGAVGMINAYAADAPDSAKNLALERLFGYLWEVERTGTRASTDPLIQSGAASILNRWRTRRAGALTPTTAAATSSGGLTEEEVERIVDQRIEDGGVGPAGPQGPAGATGPAGPAGATGPAGPAGSQGPKGDGGDTGPTGGAGARGPAGPQGPAGADGNDGATGARGPAGPKGDAGDTGAAGPAGERGPAGPAGPQGPAGADGNDGATGARGPAGPKGDAGDTGAAGPAGARGPAGPKGDAGDTGAAGPAGARGPAGPQGPAGADGNDGAAGPAGPQGDKGDKGDPGATGPRGPAGSGSTDELTARATLPPVGGFDVGDLINLSGVIYELVASGVDNNVYRGTISQNPNNYGNDYYGDTTFAWEITDPYNMRASLPKSALGISPPSILYCIFQTSDGDYDDIELARSPASDTPQNYFYVRNSGSAALEANVEGGTFSVAFYTDGARSTAQAIRNANRWERDDRNQANVNPIALAGNTDRWPPSKLTPLPTGIAIDEIFPGFQLTSTTPNRFATAPSYFNPTIDLDDHASGEFHASLELTIAPVSDANMGFVQGKANQTADDRNVALSNILFASDVAEESDFATGITQISQINGLSLFRQTVYSGSTIVGHYNIVLMHNSDNQVGAYWYWDGQAGGTGATLTAELRVTFTPSDAPAAAPARNSRGALQATSSVLPTAAAAAITGVTWTIETGSTIVANTNRRHIIKEPLMRVTPAQIGWWFVSEAGGTEVQETFVEFEGVRSSPVNETDLVFTSARGAAGMRLVITQATNGDWSINPPPNGLPANSRIKIYLAEI